ncbi:hypothetical protein V6Z11_D05G152800 [Gossypium hirsutum]
MLHAVLGETIFVDLTFHISLNRYMLNVLYVTSFTDTLKMERKLKELQFNLLFWSGWLTRPSDSHLLQSRLQMSSCISLTGMARSSRLPAMATDASQCLVMVE